MTIQFKKSEAYNKASQELTNALSSTEVSPENQAKAVENFFNAMKADVTAAAIEQARNEQADNLIRANRGENVLTAEEREFFNQLTNQVQEGIFKEEKVLPRTTVNRVFDDLVKARPLLTEIGLTNLGAVTKFIYADPTLAYAWKEIFGPITAQVNAAYRENEMILHKITSFGVIPNDMLQFGPEFIERYMRTLLVESLAKGLEFGFLKGRGEAMKEPTGLLKDFDPSTMAVTDKVSKGTITMAPSANGVTVATELYKVVADLSVNEKGESVNVAGKVVMVVSPQDAIAVQARATIQNANGVFVTALPYNIKVIESEEMTPGQALFFVQGRYDAGVAGNYTLRKFEETYALEDATLYTIKNHANGRAKDNKAAALWTLDLGLAPVVPTP